MTNDGHDGDETAPDEPRWFQIINRVLDVGFAIAGLALVITVVIAVKQIMSW